MKVKDAMKDAVQIEENAISLNGFVLNSEMINQILDSDIVELIISFIIIPNNYYLLFTIY